VTVRIESGVSRVEEKGHWGAVTEKEGRSQKRGGVLLGKDANSCNVKRRGGEKSEGHMLLRGVSGLAFAGGK